MSTQQQLGTSFDREARLPLVRRAVDALGADAVKLEGATVLVTGARGFFGRYVVEALLEVNAKYGKSFANPPVSWDWRPITIVASDSYATGNEEVRVDEWRNEPHLTLWRSDVTHASGGLPLTGSAKFTHVWHLAGIASPYWYKLKPEETIAVAVDGTRNMLKVARESGARFMFTSSSEVYQTAEIVPTPESYVGAIPSCTERSCYDVSKLMAETLCYVEAQKYGTHASAVRIFNSFGPGMGEHDRRILPRIASAMKTGHTLQVYGRDTVALPRRTYTPVANTLSGFLTVAISGDSMNSPRIRNAGIYNVGLDTDELTVPQLIARCAAAAGKPVAYKLTEPPSNYETEPLRRCPDVARLRSLGWKPCMELDEGLSAFYGWALQVYTGL